MPYSEVQRAKITAAQVRLDTANKNWQDAQGFWKTHFIDIKCYKGKKYGVMDAISWFTPNDTSCNQGAGCSHQDKKNCQTEIALVASYIGNIKVAYGESVEAKVNYDKVLREVEAEAGANANNITETDMAVKNSMSTPTKYIIFSAVAIVSIIILYLILRKKQ